MIVAIDETIENISIYSLMLFLSNNVWILVQLQLKGQKKIYHILRKSTLKYVLNE